MEVRPLRLAADWQPMLRPTRHRESFFFNPDAGRNAPTLPPEWGRGPGMAAVDPLVPFDPEAPLLQVCWSLSLLSGVHLAPPAPPCLMQAGL